MARVLVIDDEPLVRHFLRQCLQIAKHEVLEAADGAEGLDRFDQAPADLVITDIVMPNQEGLETVMALRRKYPLVPIIAISGGGRVDGRHYLRFAKRLGADHILAKPFVGKDIVKAVQAALTARPAGLLAPVP